MTETTNQAPTEDIREALKDVIDPELGVNVVEAVTSPDSAATLR